MGKVKRGKLLSNSRPRKLKEVSHGGQKLSSKATRTLIRQHHNLNKRLQHAESHGDVSLASSLKRQIEQYGGIQAYQRASIKGQSAERGGDSSRVLMDWLYELGVDRANCQKASLRLLEVGALKVDNACARSGLFDMVRIDLNSQHADILQQDFMLRPIPTVETIKADGFDLISLSLVVNYVADAKSRGDMLMRTCKFLRKEHPMTGTFPGLFLVLPAPCVWNSRYLTEERLQALLASLGYRLLKSKTSNKLVYYYLVLDDDKHDRQIEFPKKLIRDGKGLNNFAITIERSKSSVS